MRSAALVFSLLLSAAVSAAQSQDVLRDAAAAYQAGDVAAAIRLYRQFLADHPYAAEIRSNLGAALARNGQFSEAIGEYQAALKDLPNNLRVRMNLALAYYKLGQLADAMRELEAVHAQQPLETQPVLLLADCLLQSGAAKKAGDLLGPIEREYPEDRAVAYMLGMALLKQNRTREAQVLLDRILRGGESAESAYLLGQSAFLDQDIVAAEKHMARAVALNPDLPGVHSLYGQVLRSLAKLDAATQQFQEELKTNPYDFVANVETAMLLKQDGKLDDALRLLTRALQVRPADPGARNQRASIHLMQGKTDQAREELEQLVRDYPDFAEAHAALATAYYRLKRPADGDRERDAARGAPKK